MAELPGFEDVWREFAEGQIAQIMQNNPILEVLIKAVYAAAVTNMTRSIARVPKELRSVFLMKVAAQAAEEGIRSVDRLKEIIEKELKSGKEAPGIFIDPRVVKL